MPKGRYRYNNDGEGGEDGDITPNSYSDDDSGSDRGPTGIEGDYRDEEYSDSESDESGGGIVYNKQNPIDGISFDELHQRIIENEKRIAEISKQQEKEDREKKRKMEEEEENRKVDSSIKKLKSLIYLSPNKIHDALTGEDGDLELTPECIILITTTVENVIKAILMGSIEQSEEYSTKVADVALGKDNKITLPMIQIALRLSPNLSKLFSNPMLQKISLLYLDKNTQILLDKYKQILQKDNIKINLNDDKIKEGRSKLIDLTNAQNVITPVEITRILNNCYPTYSIANDGCILLIALMNEYMKLLIRRLVKIDNLNDSVLLNIIKRILDPSIVKEINQKYYILKGLYTMNWNSPDIIKIKFQMINSNGKFGKKKIYRINRIDMIRTVITQFYTELRINSEGLILVYNGVQIPDISTPEMLCMEEVTNTIFVANKRWYTLKRRNDAQKGLLNDVNPAKKDEFSCLFQKYLARKSQIKLPNINKKSPKSDSKYENDKLVKERHYGREITLPSNPDEKYKHLHRNRLLRTPQNDDESIDYSRLESAKHGKIVSPKARKPISNRHYRECDNMNDDDDNIYDLETIDEDYSNKPSPSPPHQQQKKKNNKSPSRNINKSPIIIRSPKKQQQQQQQIEEKKHKRRIIRDDDDEDGVDTNDSDDDSESENIIHRSPKRFQTLPTKNKKKNNLKNVNVDEYDDYDDVSAEMNGNEIESTLPSKPPKSNKHHHNKGKRKYLIGNELLRRLSELKTTITAILDPTKSNLESLLVNYKNVINNLDKIDTDLLLSDNTDHNGTELSVIPSELKSLYVRINDLNDKTIDRLGQVSELYEEYYNTFIDSREKAIIKEASPVYQPMKESPRYVEAKKEDLFEGIKEEEHRQNSSRPEPSPPKDDRRLEDDNAKENKEKVEEEEENVKSEPIKSPIEIKKNEEPVEEKPKPKSKANSKTKPNPKPKEKKVEREESKVSDFKEDYEDIDDDSDNNEEKPEDDNEIKDDFEEIDTKGRVTHKRKSVLENQIFHDNVDACEISDDELD